VLQNQNRVKRLPCKAQPFETVAEKRSSGNVSIIWFTVTYRKTFTVVTLKTRRMTNSLESGWTCCNEERHGIFNVTRNHERKQVELTFLTHPVYSQRKHSVDAIQDFNDNNWLPVIHRLIFKHCYITLVSRCVKSVDK